MLEWFRRKKESSHVSHQEHAYAPPTPKPIHREIYPISSCQRECTSSKAILNDGFCCEKTKGQVVAFNHVAALFACDKKRCYKKLVKIPLKVNLN